MEQRLEYGAAGAVGLAVGAANAAGEPEMRILLGADVGLFAARLPAIDDVSLSIDLRLDGIDVALAQLSALPLDVAAVASTAAAYAAGELRWAQLLHSLEGYRGFVAISAAQATAHALDMLHARRIGLVTDARLGTADDATRFFQERGFRVIDVAAVGAHPGFPGDAGSTASALAAARSIDAQNVDAIVFADCELPTLGAIDALLEPGKLPALSATLCLGWGCAQHLAETPADERSLRRWLGADASWRMRLGYAFPSALPPRPSVF